MSEPDIAIPGQDLGSTNKFLLGPGTHMYNTRIHASLAGQPLISKPLKLAGPSKRLTKITSSEPVSLPTMSVIRSQTEASQSSTIESIAGTIMGRQNGEIIPEVGSTVLCKVVRIMPRQAAVAILVVGETVLVGEWQGIIRVQDVRATEKDHVRIFESFRPGDVVRAVVISLGDQSSYYLSTARNNLGVIMATSEGGNSMYPVSWKEYRDPESGLAENRKVAKPF